MLGMIKDFNMWHMSHDVICCVVDMMNVLGSYMFVFESYRL